jgi:hypothetical protein
MKTFEEFQKSILDAVVPRLLEMDRMHHDDAKEALGNLIWDLPGPRATTHAISPDDAFLGAIFKGFTEISDSYQRLQDVSIYIRRFPFAGTDVTRSRYLHFVVEAYLQELYLLRERLIAYPKLIARGYRTGRRADGARRVASPLRDLVAKALAGPSQARGLHVHKGRYGDDDLNRLDTLELLASRASHDDGRHAFALLYRKAYSGARKKWLAQVRSNNDELQVLLNLYFGVIYPLLFDKTGRAVLPSQC